MSLAPKRKYPRVAVELETEMSVLIPESTFQPIVHSAIVTDLSERGAMVKLRLDDEVYRTLLQKTRYCRLAFRGTKEIPEKLIGKAVWIQPEQHGQETTYKIGLFFEDIPQALAEHLRAFVESLAAKQGVLPETP